MPLEAPFQFLGQSGVRVQLDGVVIYFDPYLSNSVEILDDPALVRLKEIPLKPESISDAEWVFISHAHLDHCDPYSLPAIADTSPQATFVGPAPVLDQLENWGLPKNRLHLAEEKWFSITPGLSYVSVPAAHPTIERDSLGRMKAVGYVLEYCNSKLYFAGDTGVCQELVDVLKNLAPIRTAILPVNEQNFFKARDSIIGNMSIREALLLAKEISAEEMVPIHWDMFEKNSVNLEEIRIVHGQLAPEVDLIIDPQQPRILGDTVSIVIRTLNEAKYLGALLTAISSQDMEETFVEVIVVDSGSTDDTQKIAVEHGCKLLTLSKEEFSFGRSLNVGCESARGQILVFVSGHCIPTDKDWLKNLISPIQRRAVSYTYGRQIGGASTELSEAAIFAKNYPLHSRIPQESLFVNNANAAIDRAIWQKYGFDEDLTGLEDMALAKQLLGDGGLVGYVAEAQVIHNHEESWPQVMRRYEREAIALQRIMPQFHIRLIDLARFLVGTVISDVAFAFRLGRVPNFARILLYRWSQHFGSWKGNKDHRLLTRSEKEEYFFPREG